jgi:hypothetical protein
MRISENQIRRTIRKIVSEQSGSYQDEFAEMAELGWSDLQKKYPRITSKPGMKEMFMNEMLGGRDSAAYSGTSQNPIYVLLAVIEKNS